MLTYQDFEESTNKDEFIKKAINQHKASAVYLKALEAQKYYKTQNTSITNRAGYLERLTQSKVNIKFHRLKNGFFPKAVKKLVLYLLGNGASLEDKTKATLDAQLDKAIITGAINACVDSVSWGFVGVGHILFFRVSEFVPLLDERTGELKAGIRFWQLSADKPLRIELYELDGMTEYKQKQGLLTIEKDKQAYKKIIYKDAITTKVLATENYNVLPIFPLYANEIKESELSDSLLSFIDAWDYCTSDLVDTVTLIEGVYWIVRNYGGENTATLLRELQELKASEVDGDDSGVDSHTIEAPYQAKEMILDLLEKNMYKTFGIPNPETDGRAMTATEIKAAREDMDIKADMLEWQVTAFLENALKLKGINQVVESYKRRTTTNDSETILNISTQLTSGYIDEAMAIQLDPTIPESDKLELTDRIEGMRDEAETII